MNDRTTTGAPDVHASGAPGHTQGALIDLPPIVRGRPLATRGTVEVVVNCPKCGRLHRHRGTGIRRAPCGRTYLVCVGRKQVRP